MLQEVWFDLALLAQRDDAVNQWFEKNPVAMACLFGFLGLVLLFFGVTGLMSGSARGKWGRQHSGGTAFVISLVRTLIGGGLVVFAIYKLVTGG